jgi:hypothetical protein
MEGPGTLPMPDKALAVKRAPVACRRCRRLRTKCVYKDLEPPCVGCTDSGLGQDWLVTDSMVNGFMC